MKKSIAILGCGFVNGALSTVFLEKGFKVFGYDKSGRYTPGISHPQIPFVASGNSTIYQDNPVKTIKELVEFAEQEKGFSKIYFLALPTPMFKITGKCDTRIIEGALKELAEIPGERICVIKSTVPVGFTEEQNKKFEKTGLKIIHNPEFLTEKNSINDFREQNRIILGGPRPWINKIKEIYQTAFPDVPIIKTSSSTSEMVKYFINIQLASRVVLSCELYQLCEALDKNGLNVDYDKVLEYANYDKRLGGSHMKCPGNEGIMGGNGHCFPKDLNACIVMAKENNVLPTVMEAVWKKNLEVVPVEHRDWEQMENRAVSEEEK